MSNVLDKNPIVLDTAGATSLITKRLGIVGIVVIASADNWSCVLNDADGGDLVFEGKSNVAGHRWVPWTPASATPFDGLFFQSGTNIEKILVYQNEGGIPSR